MFLENYYVKNKKMIEQGKTQAPYAYVVPAKQRRRVEAADLMNFIRREGVEVHTATPAFTIGTTSRSRPATTSSGSISRTAASSRRCSACSGTRRTTRARTTTPAGSFPCLRNVKATRIDDKTIFDKPMALRGGGLQGRRARSPAPAATIVIDHTTDNTLVTFRFANEDVKMSAAEQAFDLGGHHFAPGAFVIAERESRRARAADPGVRSAARGRPTRAPTRADARPRRAAHRLHPLVGAARRTRAGCGWRFDKLKIPYTYFGDNLVRQGNLRAKYDVIVYPHAQVQVDDGEGIPAGDSACRTRRPTSRRTSARRRIRPTTRAAASAATACASS